MASNSVILIQKININANSTSSLAWSKRTKETDLRIWRVRKTITTVRKVINWRIRKYRKTKVKKLTQTR